MKNPIAILFLILLQFSCCKKAGTIEATVHHECTGAYLIISDKEYYVCSYKKLDDFNDGQVVKITYEMAAECYGEYDRIRCAMVYPCDGSIRIKHIEKSSCNFW